MTFGRVRAEQVGTRSGGRRVARLHALVDAGTRRRAVAGLVGGRVGAAAEVEVGEVDTGVDHGDPDAGAVEAAGVGNIRADVGIGLGQAAGRRFRRRWLGRSGGRWLGRRGGGRAGWVGCCGGRAR